MCASKIGYWAAAGAGTSTATASRATSRRLMAPERSTRGSGRVIARPADLAGPIAHTVRVRDRREHHAPGLADALFVRAPAPAHDARAGAADQQRRRALQLE